MDLPRAFTAFAGAAARTARRRPLVLIAATAVLALAGAVLAVQLKPVTGIESLTGSSSRAYDKTREHARVFGADPVIVLVRGDLPRIMLSPDIAQLAGLEGCISGNIPERELKNPLTPRVCKLFAKKRYAKVVYGPGTFVNTAAVSLRGEITSELKKAKREARKAKEAALKLAQARGLPPEEQERLAKQAEELAQFRSLRDSLELSTRYGLSVTQLPGLDNPSFVAKLVFDGTRRYDQPKSRFAYIFPSNKSAVIQVRLREGLTDAQRREAVNAVRIATEEPRFKLEHGSYTVTGAPALLAGVEDAIVRSVRVLLIVALLTMALALWLAFPVELRLLPLALAAMAAAVTFGSLWLAGSGLGVGALAVLPVLIGLAVDYAVQFQYRIDRRRAEGEGEEAVESGARAAAVPVFTAAACTVVALAALALSPVPLVRSFGVLLAIGVVVALLLVVTTGFSVLAWAGGARRPGRERRPAARAARLLRFEALSRWLQGHRRALPAMLVLALAGWVLAAFGPVKSDVREMVPSEVEAVADIDTLQRETGTAGEVSVLVRAKDVTDPKVLSWMRDYQKRVLSAAGYKGERPECERAKLCPALSLSDLLATESLNRKTIDGLLDTVPYYTRSLVSEDRTSGNIAFGLRLQSLGDQAATIEMMREQLKPPKGVEADVVGLTVLGADAGQALGAWWRRLLIPALALALAAAMLLAVLRDWRLVLAPVVTVFAAGGLAELLLAVTRIDLNPLSVSLNVFVIAITTEFAVLVYLRYLRERGDDTGRELDGAELAADYRAALRATGPALFASAVTALAGFATLAASNINLLRGFALVAVVDLAAALAGTLLVLPLAIRSTRSLTHSLAARRERRTEGGEAPA